MLESVPPTRPFCKVFGDSFPRRTTRIGSNFQALIPQGPFNLALFPPPPLPHTVVMVCSGIQSPEILSFLDFCRKLNSTLLSASEQPLEEDEEALEFLHTKAGGNVDRAKLLLLSSLGGGSSFKCIHDSPPRKKSQFRVLIDNKSAKVSVSEGVSIRNQWKDWLSRTKKQLQATPLSAVELLLLLGEARDLPLFKEDDESIPSCFEALIELESKTKEVEEYIARVHDALSVIHPEERWTTSELKTLAEDGSGKRLLIKDVEILREMVVQCEGWEKQAQKWIVDDNSSSSSTAWFSLSELASFIAQGENSVADHTTVVKKLKSRFQECSTLLERLEKEVSLATPLDTLRFLYEEVHRLKISTPWNCSLFDMVSRAEAWYLATKECTTLEEARILVTQGKELRGLVDVSQLEAWVEKSLKWSEEAKRYVSNYRDVENLAIIQNLLEASEDFPFEIPEKEILQNALEVYSWTQRAQELLTAPLGTIPLETFQALAQETRNLFPPAPNSPTHSQKRMKRTELPFEEELLQVIADGTTFRELAMQVVKPQNAPSFRAAITSEEFESLFSDSPPQVKISDLLPELLQKKESLLAWQNKVRSWHHPDDDLGRSEQEMEDLLQEGKEFQVITKEFTELETLSADFKSWVSKFNTVFLPASPSTSEDTFPPSSSSSSNASKRKKRVSLSAVMVNPHSSFQYKDLLALKKEGEQLRLNVEAKLVEIDTCLRATLEWTDLVSLPLSRYREQFEIDTGTFATIPPSRGSTFLHTLGAVLDREAFPDFRVEKEECETQEGDDDELDDIGVAMQDAQERDLHLLALPSFEVQDCVWLIRVKQWIDELNESTSETALSIDHACRLLFEGMKLAHPQCSLLPEQFPEHEVEAFLSSTTKSTTTQRHHHEKESEERSEMFLSRYVHPTRVVPNMRMTQVFYRKLFHLQVHTQHYFALRSVIIKTKISLKDRTMNKLQDLLGPTLFTRRWISPSIEESTLQEDLKVTQKWLLAWEALKNNGPPVSLDYLESLLRPPPQGESNRLWVDTSPMKHMIHEIHTWLDRVSSPPKDLSPAVYKELLEEGQEWNKRVNVSKELKALHFKYDPVCMCQQIRGEEGPFLLCVDCKGCFHARCFKDEWTIGHVCPVCVAMRAVQRLVGLGFASLCRVKILEDVFLAELPPSAVLNDSLPVERALVNWTKKAQISLLSNEAILPEVPAKLIKSMEVKAISDAILAKSWGVMVEKVRISPRVGELQFVLSKMPECVPVGETVGLHALLKRGVEANEAMVQIWQLGQHTPALEVLDKCNAALKLLNSLPLQFTHEKRLVQLIVDDGATRHCLCQKFDDGSMMVHCVGCEMWFHARCVGKEDELDANEEYWCAQCAKKQTTAQE